MSISILREGKYSYYSERLHFFNGNDSRFLDKRELRTTKQNKIKRIREEGGSEIWGKHLP